MPGLRIVGCSSLCCSALASRGCSFSQKIHSRIQNFPAFLACFLAGLLIQARSALRLSFIFFPFLVVSSFSSPFFFFFSSSALVLISFHSSDNSFLLYKTPIPGREKKKKKRHTHTHIYYSGPNLFHHLHTSSSLFVAVIITHHHHHHFQHHYLLYTSLRNSSPSPSIPLLLSSVSLPISPQDASFVLIKSLRPGFRQTKYDLRPFRSVHMYFYPETGSSVTTGCSQTIGLVLKTSVVSKTFLCHSDGLEK